ncbi:hypothetical protein E3N88_09322 [Mikania micrantha]|uniref:Uncharacterized protein n=1 Tax=Mikania micrantha TaxID=192012 RepID=A0A5N6PKY4_9ASTR|nr:hypothetical protein E3N88_09322 [Mikania micrantha]
MGCQPNRSVVVVATVGVVVVRLNRVSYESLAALVNDGDRLFLEQNRPTRLDLHNHHKCPTKPPCLISNSNCDPRLLFNLNIGDMESWSSSSKINMDDVNLKFLAVYLDE